MGSDRWVVLPDIEQRREGHHNGNTGSTTGRYDLVLGLSDEELPVFLKTFPALINRRSNALP